MSAASSRSSYESIAVENDCSYPRPEHAPLNELAPRDGALLEMRPASEWWIIQSFWLRWLAITVSPEGNVQDRFRSLLWRAGR